MRRNCKVENCKLLENKGTGYCRKHGKKCACGKRIDIKAKQCIKCFHKGLIKIGRTHKTAQVTTAIAEVKEIIRCYQDSISRGKYVSLCKDAIQKLQAEIKQHELYNHSRKQKNKSAARNKIQRETEFRNIQKEGKQELCNLGGI